MKAITQKQYGAPEVLHIAEFDKPTPKDNEVLVRNYASTVNVGDLWARNFKEITPFNFSMPSLLWIFARLDFGVWKPRKKILGSEFSGEVEAVGKNVTKFAKGDKVFGYLGQGMGAYAEYLCIAEDGAIGHKPSNMTYEESAAIPYGTIMALNLLKQANIQPGEKVLINGASGGIGSVSVQFAKHLYGAEVTGVCGTPRLEFVKALGADKVIDYTKEDFTKNGETYDVIFDIMRKTSYRRCKASLNENGRYLLASFKTGELLQMLWTKFFGKKRVICALAMEKPGDLDFAKEYAEAGKLVAIIDKRYTMDEIAEAHRYVEEGHKKGYIVVSLQPQS